jgi:YidC/Oxa1 family membrane protein insertase
MWNTFFIEPLYNALIFLVNTIPGASLAIAVIILTIAVKLLLAPLSAMSLRSQIIQKKLQPQIKAIQAEYADDKQLQSVKVMELYKEHKTNPFSGCLLILLQLPIILALYRVFLSGIGLQEDLLYASMIYPDVINSTIFGIIDLAEKSILIALIAGIAQFIQMKYSAAMKTEPQKEGDGERSMQEDMAQGMQKGMKFGMPIMITVFAYIVPAAVGLYWVVNIIFSIVQEYIIRRNSKDSIQSNEPPRVSIDQVLPAV